MLSLHVTKYIGRHCKSICLFVDYKTGTVLNNNLSGLTKRCYSNNNTISHLYFIVVHRFIGFRVSADLISSELFEKS